MSTTKKAWQMQKTPLVPDRVRKIEGGFSFVPHRFLSGGFFSTLDRNELLLYFFLVLAGDREGLSYYCYDRICSLLSLSLDEYLEARNGLIGKQLIAFDGTLYQVLELPAKPVRHGPRPLAGREEMEESDPATISRLITESLGATNRKETI